MPLEVPNTFQEEFKLTCSAPETTIQHFLFETADLLQGEHGARFSLDKVIHNYGPGISVRVTFPAGGGGSIGVLFLLATSSKHLVEDTSQRVDADHSQSSSGPGIRQSGLSK